MTRECFQVLEFERRAGEQVNAWRGNALFFCAYLHRSRNPKDLAASFLEEDQYIELTAKNWAIANVRFWE